MRLALLAILIALPPAQAAASARCDKFCSPQQERSCTAQCVERKKKDQPKEKGAKEACAKVCHTQALSCPSVCEAMERNRGNKERMREEVRAAMRKNNPELAEHDGAIPKGGAAKAREEAKEREAAMKH